MPAKRKPKARRFSLSEYAYLRAASIGWDLRSRIVVIANAYRLGRKHERERLKVKR